MECLFWRLKGITSLTCDWIWLTWLEIIRAVASHLSTSTSKHQWESEEKPKLHENASYVIHAFDHVKLKQQQLATFPSAPVRPCVHLRRFSHWSEWQKVCSFGDAVASERARSFRPLRPQQEVSGVKRKWANYQNKLGPAPRIGLRCTELVPSIAMDGVPTPLRCFSECHSAEMFVDDGVETVTSVEQVSPVS